MESHDPNDRLQDYLDGAVSGPDEHTLESRLKSDPLYADRLLLLATEDAILKDWSESATVAMRAVDSGAMPADALLAPVGLTLAPEPVPLPTAPSPRRKLWRRLKIAVACLTALAGLGFLGHKLEPRAIPALIEFFWPSPGPPQGDPVAQLQDVFGDVTYFTRWEEDFKAKGVVALFADEKIQTAPLSGLATVRYPDGTTLQLAHDTTVQLVSEEEPGSKHLEFKEGFLTVEVPKQGNGQPLVLTTPHAEIRALAAHFTCLSTPQTVTVETEDGSVEMQRLVDGRPISGEAAVKVEGGFYAVAAKEAEALVAHRLVAQQVKEPRKVLTDPAGPVRALTYAPDGKMLASGSWDGAVKIWGPRTGAEVAMLPGQKLPVRCLAFFPKDLLASGGERQVRIWEIDREQVDHILPGQENDVNELAVSPNGKWLATSNVAREDKAIVKIWEWPLGQIHEIPRHAATAPCLAFSPDSKTLATGFQDGRILIWSVPSCKKLAGFKAHASDVLALRFNAKGDRLASAGRDRVAKTWRWKESKDEHVFNAEQVFTGHGSEVHGLAFSPDGLLLGTGATDGTARLWEIGSGREVATLLHRGYGVTSVAFAPDGKTFASAGWNKTIKLWDVPDRPPQE
jgi:WD40 repeat protein